MKDKLRELAERWSNRDYDETDHLQGYAEGIRQASNELLAILDAEGDGGAVEDNAQCSHCGAIFTRRDWTADNFDRPIPRCQFCGSSGAPQPVRTTETHPARSGVARDGEEGCVVAVGRLISDLRNELKHRHDVDVYDDTTDSLLSRSIIALEHFAKGERHER